MPRVFLSYARTDGEVPAAKLRERQFLEGGFGFRPQIEKAIDSVEFPILAMTPAAIRSGVVQREWRYARQRCTLRALDSSAPWRAILLGSMARR